MRAAIPTLVILVVMILAVSLLGVFGSPLLLRVVIGAMINLVVVIGLSIFIGNSGILSFGHASFAAIGAYSAAWFTLPITMKKIFLPSLPAFVLSTQVGLAGGAAIGAVTAAITAAVIGVVIVRLSGIAASIATLAWLAIVHSVFSNAEALTKGTSSLVGLPIETNLFVATFAAILALVVAFLFRFSRYGLMLQASREDEAAALASGIPVRQLRLVAFVISAAVVAIAGVLKGHFLGILAVGQFYLEFTFLSLAMLVLGGMRSLSGAVVGTFAVAGIAEILRILSSGFEIFGLEVVAMPGLREIGLAIMMLLILLVRPMGITNGRELTLPWKRKTANELPITNDRTG